jgi:hypothetical protein
MKCPLPDFALRMARATALGLLLVVAGGADARAGDFQAGAATVDITPRFQRSTISVDCCS